MRAVCRRQRAERHQVRGRRVFVGLAQRRDRAAVDQVLLVRMRKHVRHRRPDRLPVHLRCVELRPIRAHEHRVRLRLVVVHVRERRQADRIRRSHLRAQRFHVLLRAGIVAFVLRLRVYHQAVRARRCRARPQFRLAHRVRAVHILPTARPYAVRVQRRHQFRRELAPVVARPIAALHEHRAHTRRVRLRHQRRQVAARRTAQVPDPHALAFERAAVRQRCRGR